MIEQISQSHRSRNAGQGLLSKDNKINVFIASSLSLNSLGGSIHKQNIQNGTRCLSLDVSTSENLIAVLFLLFVLCVFFLIAVEDEGVYADASCS